MNKTVKGSLAGAAGIALLMGGFGSYAVWTDSAQLDPSNVQSGTLRVVANDDVSWTDQDAHAWNPGDSGDLLVPGDTITRTQTFTFSGTGKNLRGAITFTPGTETETLTSDSNSFSVTPNVIGLNGISGTGGCWEFTATTLPKTVATTVTYNLKATGTNLQSAAASIKDSHFNVVQNQTCPPVAP